MVRSYQNIDMEEDGLWYLLISKPRNEERAFHNLEQQGYRLYLPMVMREHRYQGEKRYRSEALFPRYLFIWLSREDNWAPIRSTPGVSGLVGFGVGKNRYIPVPVQVVGLLMQHEGEDGYHRLEQPEWFQRGDRVQITSGPFSGVEGIFLMDDGLHRSMVLIEMMGKQQHVAVESSQLDSCC